MNQLNTVIRAELKDDKPGECSGSTKLQNMLSKAMQRDQHDPDSDLGLGRWTVEQPEAPKRKPFTLPITWREDSMNSIEFQDRNGHPVISLYRDEDITDEDRELADFVQHAINGTESKT